MATQNMSIDQFLTGCNETELQVFPWSLFVPGLNSTGHAHLLEKESDNQMEELDKGQLKISQVRATHMIENVGNAKNPVSN